MYYSFKTKECLDPEGFAKELADYTGWPVSRGHLIGRFPFIEINRFHPFNPAGKIEDVTLSRITNLSDKAKRKLIEKAEEIADKYWPANKAG